MEYMNKTTDKLTPQAIKQEQEQLQQEYLERVEGKDVEIVMSKKRPELKVPVKVAIRKEINVSDLPAIWLFAFGNLSVEEYNKYLAENAKHLSINEINASKVLEGVMRGDKEDKAIYWRLQEKILSKPTSVSNGNAKVDIRPNAIMKSLLDEIEKGIFEEAKEGEVVDNNDHQE